MIESRRQYRTCSTCRQSNYFADDAFGLEGRYSVGARRLAVLGGTSWSFDKAAKHLREFCGIKLSDNTIRKLCQKEAVPMGRWQRNDPVANAEFTASEGDVEFTTDGHLPSRRLASPSIIRFTLFRSSTPATNGSGW